MSLPRKPVLLSIFPERYRLMHIRELTNVIPVLQMPFSPQFQAKCYTCFPSYKGPASDPPGTDSGLDRICAQT